MRPDGDWLSATITSHHCRLRSQFLRPTMEILEQAAAARGLSTASFAATLIHTIARERLFNAVLDDEQ